MINFLFGNTNLYVHLSKLIVMKTKTNFLIIAFLFATLFLSAQQKSTTSAISSSGSKSTAPTFWRNQVYDESKQYVVLKLWTANDPLTSDDKNDLQYLRQHLTGKNVKVIDYEYKNAEDLEKILKDNGIEGVTVSTDNGIHLKSENSNYNTTASNATFVFEEKTAGVKIPMMITAGNNSMNGVKRFFKLRSFS